MVASWVSRLPGIVLAAELEAEPVGPVFIPGIGGVHFAAGVVAFEKAKLFHGVVSRLYCLNRDCFR